MEDLIFFKYSQEVFIFFKLWNRRADPDKSLFAKIILYTMLFMNGLIIPLMSILNILEIVRTADTPTLFAKTMFGLAYAVGFHKIITITIYKNEIYACINKVEAIALKFRIRTDLRRSLETYKTMTKIGSIVMNACLALFLFLPILKRELPFPPPRLFVFDFYKSPYFELMYLYQTMACVAVTNLMLTYDALFCGLMSASGSILSSISREINDIHFIVENGGKPENLFKEIIEKIVETYGLIKKVSDVFSVTSLSSISYNCNQMAISVFLVSYWRFNDLTSMLMVLIVFVQVFGLWIYCYFGQNIVNQNEKLQMELYNTKWYSYPKTFKSMLLLTMFETQNDRFVMAGNIIPLSMATFAEVLKKTYAYYAFVAEVR